MSPHTKGNGMTLSREDIKRLDKSVTADKPDELIIDRETLRGLIDTAKAYDALLAVAAAQEKRLKRFDELVAAVKELHAANLKGELVIKTAEMHDDLPAKLFALAGIGEQS